MKSLLAGLAFSLTLLLAACAGQSSVRTELGPVVAAPAVTPSRAARVCPDCGRVEKIESLRVPAQGTAPRSGAVLGGVVGGVLTAPAKPGAVPAMRSVSQVSVRMDDGRRLAIRQNVISPNLRVGSRVRVSGGRVVLLR